MSRSYDLDLMLTFHMHWIAGAMNLREPYEWRSTLETTRKTEGPNDHDLTLWEMVVDENDGVTGVLTHPEGIVPGAKVHMTWTYRDKSVNLVIYRDENDAFLVESSAGSVADDTLPGLYPITCGTVLYKVIGRHLVRHLGVGNADRISSEEWHQAALNAGMYKCRNCWWGGKELDKFACNTHSNSCSSYGAACRAGIRHQAEAQEAWEKIQVLLADLCDDDRDLILRRMRFHKINHMGPAPLDAYVWANDHYERAEQSMRGGE